MSIPITSLTSVAAVKEIAAPVVAAGEPGEFASMLGGAIQGLEQYRNQADQAISNLLTGQDGELHTVALATQRAELAFDLGLQIRNKVVDAYQEVMRMQL
jgi:flagellar hook-basal body complex protein FliE